MTFDDEQKFENALIDALRKKGWGDHDVIEYPTEQELIQNWANILFENNRGVDRLNNCPLTDSEMEQIMDQIRSLKTPFKLNSFINGKTVSIKRDNPKDELHLGKEISLKIFDAMEIANGQSRYQIVKQPRFKNQKSYILPNRRGDLMLLINGMPVIHLELKRSNIPISQACNQIEKYAQEGIFTGLFSLIQIFVAMTPEETLYFANPGKDGRWNRDYYFHWADFNNEPINDWKDIASTFLSIPMAHQLIGFYTIADDSDATLKVMRSYQYYASNAISSKVGKIVDWKIKNTLGGYIWHTTGSGKTMTSFKSAQLLAHSQNADKIVFLMDRTELGIQSLTEYQAFSNDNEEVQGTENSNILITKLKSKDPANTLIVTSIQKMNHICDKQEGAKAKDLELINEKRIVFIVDEAHRSTFGDMLIAIKETFPYAIFFGFTGTPIHEENKKKECTTAMVFGDELHRYSIYDGIRDGNVLGFDPYQVSTYKDNDLRKTVALQQANAQSIEEIEKNEEKKKIYDHFMNKAKVKMAGSYDKSGKYQKGIEDYLGESIYKNENHRDCVVKDILENWSVLSQNSKFHAIFATSSIPEAIAYYRIFKKKNHNLKITTLFDPNINNDDISLSIPKEDGFIEILNDYNQRYEQRFTLKNFGHFKKDVASRLAHKKPYIFLENNPDKQIDLLIVVDQMLTGFDSKWINTLYLDKVLKYENIIQAFSRTNRLFGIDKPFGTIKYYRQPHTMKQNIEKAVEIYSGNKPFGLFADKLEANLNKLNLTYEDIFRLYQDANIKNFERLPDDFAYRAKFVKLFKDFVKYLEASRIQGFSWNKLKYKFKHSTVVLVFDEEKYITLRQRYRELANQSKGSSTSTEDCFFDLETYSNTSNNDVIDTDFINSRFKKYLKDLQNGSQAQREKILDDLSSSFASLSQQDQKYANIFLNDIQSGAIQIDENKTFGDYLASYRLQEEESKIKKIIDMFVFKNESEAYFREMLNLPINEKNLNEFGRFDNLVSAIDYKKFEEHLGEKLSLIKLKSKATNIIKNFILNREIGL